MSVGESTWKNDYFTGRYYAEYSRLFAEKHDVKLTLVSTSKSISINDLGGTKKDLISNAVPTINTATHDKPTLLGLPPLGNDGGFARLNYAYDERYLLEVSLRTNGSSLHRRQALAYFPSFC